MLDLLVSRRAVILGLAGSALLPAAALSASRPLITVHKDPNCDCCTGWVAHLKAAGFPTKVIETANINAIKSKLGVPDDLAACHTAEIDGYVIEGHVPAPAIDRLLTERPQAKGLAVPGMPSGSPGMGGAPEVYEVVLFGPERRVYGKFRGDREA